MVAEAKRSAVDETNMAFAKEANITAEKVYDSVKVNINSADGPTIFTNKVTKLIDIGDGYKRVSIAPGIHFNDLPETTLEEKTYKQAAAKSVFATQLTLRLFGVATDLDRHGGNIKIDKNTIYHYDFGSMNLTELTKESKEITGKILAQAIWDVGVKKEDFSNALINRIEAVKTSPETKIYLNGLKKDLLALGDYVNTLSSDDVASIFAKVLTSRPIDPSISKAFDNEIAFLSNSFKEKLKGLAAKSDVSIELHENQYMRKVGFTSAMSKAIDKIIKEGSGYIYDNEKNWDRVKNIIANTTTTKENLEIIKQQVSNNLSNSFRKKKFEEIISEKIAKEEKEAITAQESHWKEAKAMVDQTQVARLGEVIVENEKTPKKPQGYIEKINMEKKSGRKIEK